jgi:hypothetical protein
MQLRNKKEVNWLVNNFDMELLQKKIDVYKRFYAKQIEKEEQYIRDKEFNKVKYLKKALLKSDAETTRIEFDEYNYEAISEMVEKLFKKGFIIKNIENKIREKYIRTIIVLVKQEFNEPENITSDFKMAQIESAVKSKVNRYLRKVSKEMNKKYKKIEDIYIYGITEDVCFFKNIFDGKISLTNKLKAYFNQKTPNC